MSGRGRRSMMSIPKLTADQVADILGIARRDLARLVADGILQPSGAGARGGRRFPASQVEAVLNGSAPAAATAPRRPADRPGRRAGHRLAGEAPWRVAVLLEPALSRGIQPG